MHSLPAAPVVLPRRLRSFGSCFYLCFGFHDLLQAQLSILEARHIFGLKLPSTVSCMSEKSDFTMLRRWLERNQIREIPFRKCRSDAKVCFAGFGS